MLHYILFDLLDSMIPLYYLSRDFGAFFFLAIAAANISISGEQLGSTAD